MDKGKIIKIIDEFKKKKILVIGDIIVDRFIWGDVERVSPEAPVPVVEVEKETETFGGAGNVVNNIISLGAKGVLVGIVGSDFTGKRFISEITKRGIDADAIVADSKRPTTVKVRIIAHHQQVVRVDRESKEKIGRGSLKKLIDSFRERLKSVDAVIVSDYGKGVITKELLNTILPLIKKSKKIVTVDPKVEHFNLYKGVNCITPNLYEAFSGMGFPLVNSEKEILKLGKFILKKIKSKSLIITRGEEGMSVFAFGGKVVHIPTKAKEVFDVTGAGDTVIGVLTLALASGADIVTSANIANVSAGIVVGKLGTATVSADELKRAINS